MVTTFRTILDFLTDKCEWLDEREFWKADERIEQRSNNIRFEHLLKAYRAFREAFDQAQIRHAAVGEFVSAVVGLRSRAGPPGFPLRLIVDCKTTEDLVAILRKTKNVRLQVGVKTVPYTVHYMVAQGFWVKVELSLVILTHAEVCEVGGVKFVNL